MTLVLPLGYGRGYDAGLNFQCRSVLRSWIIIVQGTTVLHEAVDAEGAV